MPRKLHEIIAHIRTVAANPSVKTTLIQTEDLEALCVAAENDALYTACDEALSRLKIGDASGAENILDNALSI